MRTVAAHASLARYRSNGKSRVTQKFRLLVVEDEQAIREGLIDLLVFHGYEAVGVDNGPDGLTQARSGSFDLVVLDVMLPGMNGFDVCSAIRAADAEQPIIMLTAKVSDDDIVQGLKLGADDYVGKPFSLEQLMLRIAAVLRRSRGAALKQQRIELGRYVIDAANLRGDTAAGRDIAFTRREMDVLQYLYANAERPVPREELLHQIWGYAKDADIETRTVDIHIAKLRRKLESNPKHPEALITVRGAGYRLLVS